MANYFSKQQEANVNATRTKGDQLNQEISNNAGTYSQRANDAWAAAGDTKNYMLDPNATGWNNVNPLGSNAYTDLYANPEFQQNYQDPSGLGNLQQGWQGIAQWAGNQRPQYDLSSKYTGQMDTAVDPSKLGLSDRYNSEYQMTPEMVQGLATKAGRTVGNQYQSTLEAATRAADAGGMSPAGKAAMMMRSQAHGAADAGSTMADARLNALLAKLGVEQQHETTRLRAEQGLSGLELQRAQQQEATRLSGVEAGNQFQANLGTQTMAGETGLEATKAARLLGTQQMAQQGQAAQFGQNLTASQELANRIQAKAQLDQAAAQGADQATLTAMAQKLGLYTSQGQLSLEGDQSAAGLVSPSLISKLGGAALTAAGAAAGAM